MKISDTALGWIYGTLAVLGIGAWILFASVIPNYRYSHATPSQKCEIDLKKLNDDDKFCDSNYKIQSHKTIADAEAKIAEEARRAALTPKQRCQEDHKSFSDPDSGEYFVVTCKDDGTHDITSSEEIESEIRSELSTPSRPSSCNPNYSPCVPNSAYDLDCPDIGVQVRVIGSDVYRLDADGDGIGCESY